MFQSEVRRLPVVIPLGTHDVAGVNLIVANVVARQHQQLFVWICLLQSQTANVGAQGFHFSVEIHLYVAVKRDGANIPRLVSLHVFPFCHLCKNLGVDTSWAGVSCLHITAQRPSWVYSEQRQLCLLCLDALASLVEIILVEFKADEVPLFLDASDGCCA